MSNRTLASQVASQVMPTEELNPLLLDTHIWLFLGMGENLSPDSQGAIQRAAEHGNLWVSAISIWEIGMLTSKGRLHLAQPGLQWVRHALRRSGLHLKELHPEIAIESSYLPGEFHADPADRLIVATARVLEATLMTRDEKILAYGQKGFVSTLKG